MLIAAVCHDLGHDGYTNSYHVNKITSRAINSNDLAVQEAFHAAELFRILSDDYYNFIEGINKEEFRVFRKRVCGLILGTDMARHVADLSALKALISDGEIQDGQNVDKLLQGEDAQKFKNQQ